MVLTEREKGRREGVRGEKGERKGWKREKKMCERMC